MMWEMRCSYSASPLGGHYQINDHRSDVTPTKVGRTNTQSLSFLPCVVFLDHPSFYRQPKPINHVWKRWVFVCFNLYCAEFEPDCVWVSGDVTPTNTPWHVFCVCDTCVQDHACGKAMCCKQCAEPGQAEVGRGGEDVLLGSAKRKRRGVALAGGWRTERGGTSLTRYLWLDTRLVIGALQLRLDGFYHTLETSAGTWWGDEQVKNSCDWNIVILVVNTS